MNVQILFAACMFIALIIGCVVLVIGYAALRTRGKKNGGGGGGA